MRGPSPSRVFIALLLLRIFCFVGQGGDLEAYCSWIHHKSVNNRAQ